MSKAILSVQNVTKRLKGRTVVDSMSFELGQGNICGFVGPNGAGKTTLIRMMTGLIAPTAGEIRISGFSVQKERRQALRRLGAIVESPIFFPYMSGRQNLQNLARLHPDLAKAQQKKKVEEVLEVVGLADRGQDRVDTYSLGMKQRLGIAQALLGTPDIILLDEPANGLDPMGMRELRELVLRLRDEQGITFFISRPSI